MAKESRHCFLKSLPDLWVSSSALHSSALREQMWSIPPPFLPHKRSETLSIDFLFSTQPIYTHIKWGDQQEGRMARLIAGKRTSWFEGSLRSWLRKLSRQVQDKENAQ
ncbi:hypothetical protein E5676_scaffold562G00680 [Cucumis melo var. makuwa]|uniref:Uncharacterized protein n=1 Tax=Cucumis melo var. makuwa TaxID=1194695 RepID=A0A5D3BKK6_CUCMM|nr:hypothetical protein E5676_scaffold562G00680 [Cucumis melo var. makuwa]